MAVEDKDDIMEVFCPGCGQAVKCKKTGGIPNLSIEYYDGKCDECEKPVLVEDRAAFEQDGEIEVIFK